MDSYLAVPQGRNLGCVFRRSQSDSDWRLLGMVHAFRELRPRLWPGRLVQPRLVPVLINLQYRARSVRRGQFRAPSP